MERLTVKRSDGRWALANNGGAKPLEQMEKIPLAIDRLAAYEDTGLEPEEIKAVIEGAVKEFSEYDELMPKHRIKELAQAEKDGRLVAYMPGDKVYDRFGTPWIVKSSEIHLIGEEIKHLYRCGHPGTEDYRALYEEEIRTRKGFDAALKRGRQTMRLIDADALYERFNKAAWYDNADRDDVALELIFDAPTITMPPNDPLTLEELLEMAWSQSPVWCSDTDGLHAGLLCVRDDWDAPEKTPHIWLLDEEGDSGVYSVKNLLNAGARFYRRRPEES